MGEYSYGVYFIANGQRVRLPVNPQEVSVVYGGENTNYNLAGVGEVVIPRLPKLATIEIESYFPRNAYTAATVGNSWYKPEVYVDFFTKLQRQKIVFQFVINRYDGEKKMFNTSIYAVISDFKITDKGGESGDVYFAVSVQEYRNTAPKKVEVISVDADSDMTKLAQTEQRLIDAQEIVVGDVVTVTGQIFEKAEQTEQAARTARKYLNQSRQVVARVLPPDTRAQLHKVYISGVGWVDKGSCVKANAGNIVNRVQSGQ